MSNSRAMGFILGQEIRIPHTRWCSQTIKSKQVLKNRGDFYNPEEKENNVRQVPRERGNRIQNKGRKINKMKEQVCADKFVSFDGEQLRSCCMMTPVFSEK